MSKEVLKVTDLKDMLNKTGELYGDRPGYKIKIGEGKYKVYTHKEIRDMINYLGTTLISLGLKDKRIAVIGENRYEWELSYMSVVCGTGVVVPIVSEGDTIGSVIFVMNDGESVSEVETKLAESAAGFLGRHMEG